MSRWAGRIPPMSVRWRTPGRRPSPAGLKRAPSAAPSAAAIVTPSSRTSRLMVISSQGEAPCHRTPRAFGPERPPRATIDVREVAPMIAERLIERARNTPRRIVFPESTDGRILEAAAVLAKEGIARPILVGAEGPCREAARSHGVALDGIEVV